MPIADVFTVLAFNIITVVVCWGGLTALEAFNAKAQKEK